MSMQIFLSRFKQAVVLNRCPVLTVEELHKLDQQRKLARLGYKNDKNLSSLSANKNYK
jgi:hypothetical protein